MASLPPNLQSKAWILSYVQTAWYDAGQYLQTQVNEEAVKVAQDRNEIKGEVRPLVFNYFDQRVDHSWRWNWGAHLLEVLFSPRHQQSDHQQTSKKETAEEKEKREKETQARHATVGGSIAFIVGGLVTGRLYGYYTRYIETARYTSQVAQALINFSPIPLYLTQTQNLPGLPTALTNLVRCQLEIDKMRARKMTHYFYAALGFVAGSAALAFGGIFRVHSLLKPGLAATIASLFWAAVNAGVHWDDELKIRRNYELIAGNGQNQNGWASYILYTLLPHYDERLSLIHAPSNYGYQPLYPDLYDVGRAAYPAPSAPPYGT